MSIESSADLNVPNECLMVVAGGGNVARGMRRPSDAIDASAMIRQTRHGSAGHAHVQDDDLGEGKGEGRA